MKNMRLKILPKSICLTTSKILMVFIKFLGNSSLRLRTAMLINYSGPSTYRGNLELNRDEKFSFNSMDMQIIIVKTKLFRERR